MKNGLSDDAESGSPGPKGEGVGGIWSFSPQISAQGYFSSQLYFNLFLRLLGVFGAMGPRKSALVVEKAPFLCIFLPQNLLGWSPWVLTFEIFYFMLFFFHAKCVVQLDVIFWFWFIHSQTFICKHSFLPILSIFQSFINIHYYWGSSWPLHLICQLRVVGVVGSTGSPCHHGHCRRTGTRIWNRILMILALQPGWVQRVQSPLRAHIAFWAGQDLQEQTRMYFCTFADLIFMQQTDLPPSCLIPHSRFLWCPLARHYGHHAQC